MISQNSVLMQSQKPSHIDFLDVIRGIAILFVFLFHSLAVAFNQDQLPWGTWLRDLNVPSSFLILLPASFGWAGVPIFFVISGFCIHLSFSQNRNWGIFFQRRFFRIYPPYLVALIFFSTLYPITKFNLLSSWNAVAQFTSHLALLHNFDIRSSYAINSSFWSIAVEVQLYILYPILILLTTRFGWRGSLFALGSVEIVLRMTDGILFTINNAGLPQWISGSPFIYWFSWSIGAFLADCHLHNKYIFVSRGFLLTIMVSAVASNFLKPFSSMTFPLFAIFTAGIIAKFLNKPEQHFHRLRFILHHLQNVGIWSFSIYLLHGPLLLAIPIVIRKITPNSDIHSIFIFLICIMSWFVIVPISYFYYRWCELPSISLGKLLRTSNIFPKLKQ